jgi:hypothetical protein
MRAREFSPEAHALQLICFYQDVTERHPIASGSKTHPYVYEPVAIASGTDTI